MSRRVVWLQLLIGWLPVWALFTTLVLVAHSHASLLPAAMIGLRLIVAGAALGLLVQKLTERYRWPERVGPGFVALHFVAAIAYSVAWVAANSLIESIVQHQLVLVIGLGAGSFLIVGVWLYVMIAGVSYAVQSTDRAARAEAAEARAKLAGLRSQLNPHFLFNALHTVVQLIPHQPALAGQAAEKLAGLLRTTIEEDRDVVSLGEEIAFVEKYLELERIRFSDRLRVRIDVSAAASAATVPSFAVQTLVENAVRHGVAPSVDPVDLVISGEMTNGALIVTVSDTGAGLIAKSDEVTGTGLRRLRQRLTALYGDSATFDLAPATPRGTIAILTIPEEGQD